MKDNTYHYYAENMMYNNDKSLNYLLFEEGLVNKGTSAYAYEYHIKDHLGNTRVAFQPNGSSTTLTQVAEYYPFGSTYLPIYNGSGTSNKYLYNGKEKQDDVLGTGSIALDWYDYGRRMYDPQIGRFHVEDRKAEKYFNFTPYQYATNNPLRYIDVNGDSIGVDKSITGNENLNLAFKQFAGTKGGGKFLANYAAKGQTLYDHTFNKDGKYHTKGIDLNYKAYEMNSRGETGAEIKDGRAVITVGINSSAKVEAYDGNTYNMAFDPSRTTMQNANDISRGIFNRSLTFFHESFIHADLDTQDYLDDKQFNNSNISQENKDWANETGTGTEHLQHYQVYFNGANDTWPGAAYGGIIEVNSNFGQFYTNGQLGTMMWNYSGGK